MPKIKVSGVDIDKYSTNTSLEDLKYSLESTETPFNIEQEISNEGAVGRAFKAAATATRMGIGAAKEAKGMVKSAARMVKSQWRNIFPQLLQGFQKFGRNLRNMWAKLMKYDKRFLDLGENMHELVNLGGANQINRMGKVSIKIYPIDWEGVQVALKYIRSWNDFVIAMSGMDPSTGKIVGKANNQYSFLQTVRRRMNTAVSGETPEGSTICSIEELGIALNGVQDRDQRIGIIEFAAKRNNLILARYNANTAIAKMVYTGRETALANSLRRANQVGNGLGNAAKNLVTLHWLKMGGNLIGVAKNTAFLPLSMCSDAIANAFGLTDKQKMKRLTGSDNSSAKIVETVLKGFNPVEIEFTGNDRDRFVAWIQGRGNDQCGDYCSNIAKFLSKGTEGGSLLSKAIKTGGDSCKATVDKTLKTLQNGMKTLYGIAQTNDHNTAESVKDNADGSRGSVGAGAGGASVDLNDTGDNNQNDGNAETEQHFRSEVDALNAFMGSYKNILGILADNYQGFVQGLLMTTYSIVEDGESIVSVVNQMRGGDPKEKGKQVMSSGQNQ